MSAVRRLAERHHLRWWEVLPWIAGVAAFFACGHSSTNFRMSHA